VFLDGRPLLQVAADPGPGQFAVDGARRVLLADDPTGRTVEVTVRPYWVVGRAAGVTVRGFTMKHAAAPAQRGGIDNLGFRDWTVARNVLSDAHGGVVGLRDASGLQLLDNDIFRGGLLGVASGGTTGLVVRGNRIHDNNTEAAHSDWEAAGMKMGYSQGTLIEGNEVWGNDGLGIWCDISCTDFTARGNRVHHNAYTGIAFEISDGAKITGNAVWENGWAKPGWGWGAGITIASSANAEVWGNTVAWNGDGIAVISQNRGDAPATVGTFVHDNVIVGAAETTLLGWFQDWGGILHAAGSDNRGAGNAYWGPAPEPAWPRFEWATVVQTLAEFNATPGEEGGRYLSAAAKDQALGAAGVPLAPES
jgi:hypothetical protein